MLVAIQTEQYNCLTASVYAAREASQGEVSVTSQRNLSAPVVWVVDTGSPRWHARLSLQSKMYPSL